jgi:hypothetical protein
VERRGTRQGNRRRRGLGSGGCGGVDAACGEAGEVTGKGMSNPGLSARCTRGKATGRWEEMEVRCVHDGAAWWGRASPVR